MHTGSNNCRQLTDVASVQSLTIDSRSTSHALQHACLIHIYNADSAVCILNATIELPVKKKIWIQKHNTCLYVLI